MTEPRRFLATVLFTDIVGSTERATELGDRAWRALLEKHHAVVRQELSRYGGREVATAGDGFLAVFEDPEVAIRCANAIRGKVQTLGLSVRCGLHTGEIERSDRNVGGIAIHIGARVAACAEADEVLVSSTVHDVVEGAGFEFEDRGTQALKGVRGEWRLYAVTRVGAPVPLSLRGRLLPRVRAGGPILIGVVAFAVLFVLAGLYMGLRERRARVSIPAAAGGAAPAIAVLPFSVSDSALAGWREAMVDLLSANLDDVGGLRTVDGRTVFARWRERVPDSDAVDLATTLGVARATGARYAVLGNAVSLGHSVRLAADVYDLQNGSRLGGSRQEGSPDSVYTLVDRLSMDVVSAIVPKERVELQRLNLADVTTHSLTALKSFLEGEALLRRADFQGAVEAYSRAVEADSTFALAMYHLGLASGWVGGLDLGVPREYLQRAARLADRLPERKALVVRAESKAGTLDEVKLLRQAVERYPDDPDAWYFLGDALYHLGPQMLVGRKESEHAFSRAVELDPAFAPAYIHLVELAIARGDSVRSAALLQKYEGYVGDAVTEWGLKLAFGLAFGDSASSARLRDSLPVESPQALGNAVTILAHARFQPEQQMLLEAALKSDDLAPGAIWGLTFSNLAVGRLERALEYTRDPRVYPIFPAVALHTVYHLGLPVTEEELEREMVLGAADTALDLRTFHVGLYELDRGSWKAAAIIETWARKQAERSVTEGDSISARSATAMAEILRGYSLWRRGDLEKGLHVLSTTQKEYVGLGLIEFMQWHLRLFVGDVLLELGRFRDAKPYFESYGGEWPLAWYHLGHINEEIGRYDEARQAYQSFADAWRDADPGLQPMVTEARQAARRLTSVVRE